VKQYYVYVLSSRSRNLYVGVTSDLERRLSEHRKKSGSFTQRYRITRLVYFEVASNPSAAIAREKQIKAFRRSKKTTLVESMNPAWNDLSQVLGLKVSTTDSSLRSE
jgi:putative endonuclease